MKRVILGGFAAGIVFFIWGAIAHTVLPIGEMGFATLQNEDAVLATMRASITEPGLYFIPGYDMNREVTDEEKAAWEQKYQAGPTGLLVYSPDGRDPKMVGQLVAQLITDIVSALILAFLLSLTALTFGKRVGFALLAGLFAWIAVSMPLWTWYGFPGAYVIGGLIELAVGWTLAGLVLGAIVKPAAE